MGQLERYGLYVLCVVIVMILGVAIWGGDSDPLEAAGPAHQLDHTLTAQAPRPEPPLTVDPSLADPPSTPVEDRFFDRVEPIEAELTGVAPVDPVASQIDARNATVAQPVPEKAPAKTKPAAAKPKPRSSALRTYTVKKGDTIEGIAKRVLRSISHVETIKKLNPGVNPRRMRPGMVLKLPWVEAKAGSGPDASAPPEEWTEYVVVKGDSASAISQKVYKTVRYANDILEWNDIADPTKLRPKQVLRLPPLH